MFVALGLLITVLAGRRQLRLKEVHDTLTTTTTTDLQITDNASTHAEYRPRGNSLADTFDNSIHDGGVPFDQTFALLVDNQKQQSSESTPLLAENEESDDSDEFTGSRVNFVSTLYGTNESTIHCSPCSTDAITFLNKTVENGGTSQPYQGQSFKAKIVLICVATYFSTGLMVMFTVTGSDFVGKAIYGGDPEGNPGSESLMR